MSGMRSKYYCLFGLFGLFGFFGLRGIAGEPALILFFSSFAFFSVWWSSEIIGIDERLIVNRALAGSKVFKWAILFIFLTSLAACYLVVDPETMVRVLLAIISCTFAIAVNAWAWLTHRYDRNED